jgi:hypothetical protein
MVFYLSKSGLLTSFPPSKLAEEPSAKMLNTFKCSRTVTFWYGSDPQIPLKILFFSPVTFKTPSENIVFLSSYAYYFLKAHLHHSSKIKSHKNSQNSINECFSSILSLLMEGSGPGSRQINYGSGSKRSKNTRIRIRYTEIFKHLQHTVL